MSGALLSHQLPYLVPLEALYSCKTCNMILHLYSRFTLPPRRMFDFQDTVFHSLAWPIYFERRQTLCATGCPTVGQNNALRHTTLFHGEKTLTPISF